MLWGGWVLAKKICPATSTLVEIFQRFIRVVPSTLLLATGVFLWWMAATFITGDKQTNMAQLSTVPGNAFEADAVLPDPHQAGMQVSIKWPYSANVHCEIDVDHNVLTQVDQVVRPAPGSSDPLNGVLSCGAPLPSS